MIDGVMGPTESTLTLQLHDRIELGGMEGTVVNIDETVWHGYPVSVLFDCGLKMELTLDGRQYLQQSHALVKVIGKVEPKVKRWRWLMKDAYGNWMLSEGLYTEKEAITIKGIRKIEETEVEE